MTSPTPAELAALAEKLATTSKALAEAEKTRAEADQVRAGTEKERQLAQNAADVAAADLDGKRIANDKARAEADSARIDKLISQLSGAVPDLSTLQKNTVSFSDGRVLRQAEANASALAGVTRQIAKQVIEALPETAATLFVTAEPKLVAAVASYRQLRFEAELLQTRLAKARDDAQTSLQSADAGFATLVDGASAALVVAGVAGKAITEVASLFEIDVAVTSSTTDIPAATVHAAILHDLLALTKDRTSTIVIRPEWARVPDPKSPLLKAVESLTTTDQDAAATLLKLQAQIEALGDPAGDRATALKPGQDAKSAAERKTAERNAEAATTRLTRLDTLIAARSALEAAVAKAKAFADRVSTVASETGISPLAAAYRIEPLASPDPTRYILLLDGATAEANQVVVTRRLLAPRVHVSTSVAAHYLLLNDDGVVAADRVSASAAYATKITSSGDDWTTIRALGG